MSTVYLNNLRCLATTGGGADDTYAKIYVDGRYKARWPDRGDHDMDRGDRARINRSYDFNNEVKIELWEYDSGSSDDYMGSCKITNQEKGHRNQRIRNREEGDEYELTYEVTTLRHLKINRVQCLAPASGITNWTRGIFGTIAGAIAIGFTASGATVTGGALYAAIGKNASAATSSTIAAIETLDNITKGQDDLYIKINGEKVWPNGKYHGAHAFKPINPRINKPFKHDKVVIELMEYDSGSGDDLLGRLEIDTRNMKEEKLKQTLLVGSEAEGSLYEVHIEIS